MIDKNKIFVIDTNVILYDYRCIFDFDDNDIVIPIVVLEELDKLKRGNDTVNFQAREFIRILNDISKEGDIKQGISLGTNMGKLWVEGGKFSETVSESFPEKTPDHRILSIAEYIHTNSKDRKVKLITKDINLRMKAKSLGLDSEDYETGKIRNIDQVDKKTYIIENQPSEIIDKLYNDEGDGTIKVSDISVDFEGIHNSYLIIKGNSNSSALVKYDKYKKLFIRIKKDRPYGIEPRNAEQTFATHALLDSDISLISITGKAGTGKTLLALASALAQRRNFHQIFLARPIVPLSNKDIGYLPGDVDQKIGPYMEPLYDNLSVIKNQYQSTTKEYQNIEEMLKTEKLVISPLAYIRGRSLSNIFFIVDEAQNLTPHEIKTIITRAGENTKFVFTGDIHQIDSPWLDSRSNGLSYLTDKMKDQKIFSHINLMKGERSMLADLASTLL